MTKKAAHNKVLPKAGLNGFDWAFVQGSTFVLRLNICAKNPRLRQYPNRCGEIALRDSFATTWRQPALPVAQSLPTVDFAQLAVWQNHSARKLRLRSVTSPSCRHVTGNVKRPHVPTLFAK